MFGFQREQTAACIGKAGGCGRTAEVAQLQDELTGALVGLSRATDGGMQTTPETWRLMIEGLFTTATNANFNEETIREMIGRVRAEKTRLAPDCASCAAPCGRTSDYDMKGLWNAGEDIRSLKSLILFGVRGMAIYAQHAMVLGYTDDEVNRFFGKALFVIGEDWGMEELLPVVREVGEKNLKCMALLDKANEHMNLCREENQMMTIAQIMEKMIAFSEGNIHDITHLSCVWTYAKTIGELEGLDAETQFILEVAAVTHDIACPLCRKKYGNTNGSYQEQEGDPLVREFLADTGMTAAQIDRVAYLVGHHHSPAQIDGIDYQILIEADYIVNASESGYSQQTIQSFMEHTMKTAAGIRLTKTVFGV